MAFTGKLANSTLDLQGEAEDLGDIVGIVSPYETPLLDHLGNARCTASEGRLFSQKINVTGGRPAGVSDDDELDYQKQERLRELLRDLENHTIEEIISLLGHATIEAGGEALTEAMLDAALKKVTEASGSSVDTIAVGGLHKRSINGFISSVRSLGATPQRFRDLVSVYEAESGVCRIVLSRWVPKDTVLLLDSSDIEVRPVNRQSFRYLPHPALTHTGQVAGTYGLHLGDVTRHGLISNLSAD